MPTWVGVAPSSSEYSCSTTREALTPMNPIRVTAKMRLSGINRHAGAARASATFSATNHSRRIDPQIELHAHSRHRQERHFHRGKRQVTPGQVPLPHLVGRKEIAQTGMVLLDAHGVGKRCAGGAAYFLRVLEQDVHLRLHGRAEIGLSGAYSVSYTHLTLPTS